MSDNRNDLLKQVLLMDLRNIAEAAETISLQAVSEGFEWDDDLFNEVRQLRDRIIRL